MICGSIERKLKGQDARPTTQHDVIDNTRWDTSTKLLTAATTLRSQVRLNGKNQRLKRCNLSEDVCEMNTVSDRRRRRSGSSLGREGSSWLSLCHLSTAASAYSAVVGAARVEAFSPLFPLHSLLLRKNRR